MSTSPMIVITNFFGTKVNAANAGVGLKNPDGTYNVSGTAIGLGQTAQSAVDFALTGVTKVSPWVPGIGAALGLASVVDSAEKISDSRAKGESPAQADIAGFIGGVAAFAGGAALILGGGVIVPVAVVVGVAAGTWQVVAAAKGWTLDDLGFPVERPLSDDEKSQVAQGLKDLANQSAYNDAMSKALGGGSLAPVDDSNLWGAPEAFEPTEGLAKTLDNAIVDAMQAAREAGKTAQQAVDAIGKALLSVSGILTPLLAGGNSGFLAEALSYLAADWTTAKNTVSPLILDLDGDGLVETQSKTAGVYFDHAGDGFAEATGWAASDDGLLVRDINGDGSINNGGELFGNNTRLSNGQNAANGFEALKDLDSNKDGKLNSADAAWNTLRVWKDTDGDAETDTGELLTLAQAGITEFKLAYTNAGNNPDQHGNEHKQTSTYTTTAGTTRAVHDVWFATDNWKTIDQRTPLELSSEVAAMPEVIGSGTLGSLRQAMMRDTSGQLIAAANTEYSMAA